MCVCLNLYRYIIFSITIKLIYFPRGFFFYFDNIIFHVFLQKMQNYLKSSHTYICVCVKLEYYNDRIYKQHVDEQRKKSYLL